ncbi:jg26756, partial [Pararge aegeria aegeria]
EIHKRQGNTRVELDIMAKVKKKQAREERLEKK